MPMIVNVMAILAGAILAFTGLYAYKKGRDVEKVMRASVKDMRMRFEVENAKLIRETEISRLFSHVLIDLAHTDNIDAVNWKFGRIRGAELVMITSGYYNDCMRDWLVRTLTDAPPESLNDTWNQLKEATRGYQGLYQKEAAPLSDLFDTVLVTDDLLKETQTLENYSRAKFSEALKEASFTEPLIDTTAVEHREVSLDEVIKQSDELDDVIVCKTSKFQDA